MVAGAVSGRLGDALALEKYPVKSIWTVKVSRGQKGCLPSFYDSIPRMRPGARRHLNVDVFSNALQPDDTAEHRLRHRYSCVRVHVAALPPKVLRLGDPEGDENLKHK